MEVLWEEEFEFVEKFWERQGSMLFDKSSLQILRKCSMGYFIFSSHIPLGFFW